MRRASRLHDHVPRFSHLLVLVLLLYCRTARGNEDSATMLEEARAAIVSHYVRPIAVERLKEPTIAQMLAQLDPHCAWFPRNEADRLRAAMHGRRGAIGAQLQPTVRRRDGAALGQSVEWCDAAARIAYLRIGFFSAETPREVRAAIFQLKRQKAAAIVLDLRSCPGGLLAAGVEVADLFLSSGPIVHVVGRDGRRTTHAATSDATQSNCSMVVLVDRQTASTAEILAACLQDARRARLFGERTAGKGSVQSLIDLPSGAMLKLTTATYHRPSGIAIGIGPDTGRTGGVVPDFVTEPPPAVATVRGKAGAWYDAPGNARPTAAQTDRTLARAVQFLRDKLGR